MNPPKERESFFLCLYFSASDLNAGGAAFALSISLIAFSSPYLVQTLISLKPINSTNV